MTSPSAFATKRFLRFLLTGPDKPPLQKFGCSGPALDIFEACGFRSSFEVAVRRLAEEQLGALARHPGVTIYAGTQTIKPRSRSCVVGSAEVASSRGSMCRRCGSDGLEAEFLKRSRAGGSPTNAPPSL